MGIKYIYKSLLLLGVIALTSCEKFMDEDIQSVNHNYFYGLIEIENYQVKYNTGDTIWFSANINDDLSDSNTGELISLENQTFIFNGVVNLLKPKFDSLLFIYQNSTAKHLQEQFSSSQ